MKYAALLSAVAAAAPAARGAIPTLTLNNGIAMPRMLLGTGGGGGGYNVSAWLGVTSGMTTGFDSAYTYCYNSAAPFCSHVAIYDAVSAAGLDPTTLFYVSKIEPEDFGPTAYMSGFGRVVDRGILQDLAIARLDMLMAHQAGRHETDSNYHPPCFDASGAGGNGTYYPCRVQMMQSFLQIQKQGLARSVAVSNWQVRDLQQVFDATGVFPAANEIEVHPYWHEDDTIAFCRSHNITVINSGMGRASAGRLCGSGEGEGEEGTWGGGHWTVRGEQVHPSELSECAFESSPRAAQPPLQRGPFTEQRLSSPDRTAEGFSLLAGERGGFVRPITSVFGRKMPSSAKSGAAAAVAAAAAAAAEPLEASAAVPAPSRGRAPARRRRPRRAAACTPAGRSRMT